MLYLPFLKQNIRVMNAGPSSLAASWLKRQDIKLESIKSRLILDSQNRPDWITPEGTSLMHSIEIEPYYAAWTPQERPASSATLIIGSNLGYGLNQVLKHSPRTHKVVLIEPDPFLLTACLGLNNYFDYLTHGKLIVLPPDKEIIWQALRQAEVQYYFGRIYLREDIPSLSLGHIYAQWGKACQELLESLSVTLNTLRLQQDIMVDNELANFSKAIQNGSIGPLKNSAQGLPAVILGAGPSLNSFGKELKNKLGSAICSTGLQNLPSLYQLGLKPHICMAIDYSKGMRALFDRLEREWAKDIPLIYSTKIDPKVLNQYPGPAIPCWTLGGIATFLLQEKDEPLLDVGGNVSVALFRFLKMCGVSCILLAGLDFAWRNGYTHAPGHHAHKHIPKNIVELTNAQGDTIYSTLSYTSALRELNKDIQSANFPVYNLYRDGAIIEGAQAVCLEEISSRKILTCEHKVLRNFQTKLAQCFSTCPKFTFSPQGDYWKKAYQDSISRLDEIFTGTDISHSRVRSILRKLLFAHKNDKTYQPYLYNEILDLSRLVQTCPVYSHTELKEFKQLKERVMTKINRMDAILNFYH